MLLNPRETKDDIVRWIRSYFEENGPACSAVVGISGGKDSSIVAALCVEALGPDRVVGVTMPNGRQPDIDDSIRLIKHLKIEWVSVNIQASFRALQEEIGNSPTILSMNGRTGLSRQAEINLPARIRMATLYAVAQSLPNGGRVANTCNRSEDYVGYSTKFGDAAGDFSPLSSLLVHEVYQIGEVLGLPKDLVHKTPSDGLCGSTDEDNLGFSYAQLDQYITTGECQDTEVQRKIETLHDRNIHKFLPMPCYRFPCDGRRAV